MLNLVSALNRERWFVKYIVPRIKFLKELQEQLYLIELMSEKPRLSQKQKKTVEVVYDD